MNEDTFKSDIEDWIDWSRENLSSLDDLPLIGNSAIEPPWRELALEYFFPSYERAPENNDLATLCQLFESELAGNPSDVAIRFSALDFYHDVVHLESLYAGEDPYLALLLGYPSREEILRAGSRMLRLHREAAPGGSA